MFCERCQKALRLDERGQDVCDDCHNARTGALVGSTLVGAITDPALVDGIVGGSLIGGALGDFLNGGDLDD